MRKLLLAIVALGALAWSETASALVQTTDESFLNKGMPVAGGTATLNFNTPATASAPKRTIVHVVVRIKKTGHATVRTDTMQVQKGTGMTVDVVVTTDDGQTFTITDVPVETFYGGVIEVGGGGGGPGMQFGGPFMPMLPPGGHPPGLSISSRWSGVYSRATLIEKDAVSNVTTGLFEQFNTVGRVGVGASWAGLPSILGVSLVPFFSYDHLNQDLTQNFGSGCICEEIKNILSAGVHIPVVVYDNADFYAIVGATWVEKEFQIFFSPLSTTVTHTMLGPTAGLGVTGVVPGYTWLHWYFQYQHGWLPDFNLYRPNAAPGSNYVFQNSYDQGTVGFSIRLWNPFGPMP